MNLRAAANRMMSACLKAGRAVPNLCRSAMARPYRRLFFIGDNANWVLSWEFREIEKLAGCLGISTCRAVSGGIVRQALFYSSKYVLRGPEKRLSGTNRIAFPYFHGYPSSGEPIHVDCYERLKKHHEKVSRIQVSHTRMQNLILETGICSDKVFLIPIGINPDFFHRQTPQSRAAARQKFSVPRQAVVVGSFQKDGNGWGEGREPKLIKGPDIFIRALERLKASVPEVFVLLSGPARGYVKAGLERLRVPYRHIYLDHYPDIGELFQCLDLYIVASREEGGPKAVLESMASGVPLVTTRVGQAMDLVRHGQNAWMAEVEDADALADGAVKVLSDSALQRRLIENGLETVPRHTYAAQLPLWKRFFQGFVEQLP